MIKVIKLNQYILNREVECHSCDHLSWWRPQMETFSAILTLCVGNSPVTGEFPTQRPVTWSFDVFFDLRLHKRLSKQSLGWRFETPSRSLWRQCNDHLGFSWWLWKLWLNFHLIRVYMCMAYSACHEMYHGFVLNFSFVVSCRSFHVIQLSVFVGNVPYWHCQLSEK